jgi:uncharacterized Tic20 family protein
MGDPTLDRKIRYSAMLHVAVNVIILLTIVFALTYLKSIIHSTYLPLVLLAVLSILALILWTIVRRKHPFVEKSLKKSLNFTLSLIVYGLIPIALFALLCFIWWCVLYCLVVMIGMSRIGTSAPMPVSTDILEISSFAELALIMGQIIFTLLFYVQASAIAIGSIQAVRGRVFNYPLTIDFL